MWEGLLLFSKRQKEERESVRYDLIFETAQEEDRNFSDTGQDLLGSPFLVTERSEISCRREGTIDRQLVSSGLIYCGTHCGMTFFRLANVFSKIKPLMSFAP